MNLRRKYLLGMLIPAAMMTLMQIAWPNDGLELLCIVYALPVLMVNYWVWFEPEVLEGIIDL